MKTVKMNEEVRRVKDEDAIAMVKKGWVYVAKEAFKRTPKQINTEVKEDVVEVAEEVVVKTKKPRKRSNDENKAEKDATATPTVKNKRPKK